MADHDDLFEQVAKTLEVTPDELRAFNTVGPARLSAIRESVELMNAFHQLEDKESRQRCLSFVKAEAVRCKK